jgi:hypothetical protein
MARRRNVRNVAGLLDPLLSLRGLFLLQRLTLLLRMGLSRRLVRHGQPFTGGRRSRDSRRRPAGLPRTASLSATLLDGLICAPTRPRAGNGRSAGVCRSGAVLGWCVVGDSPGQSTSTRLVRSLAADYRATGVPGDVLTLRLWAYFAASDDAFTVHAGAQVGLQPAARRRCIGQPLLGRGRRGWRASRQQRARQAGSAQPRRSRGIRALRSLPLIRDHVGWLFHQRLQTRAGSTKTTQTNSSLDALADDHALRRRQMRRAVMAARAWTFR